MTSLANILSLISIFTIYMLPIHAQENDVEMIKSRVVEELLKTPPEDQHVEEILNIMNEDGSFQGIDYSDLSRTAGFPHRRHTRDLVDLAIAYRDNDSQFYQDQHVKEKIIQGLTFWVENDFVGDNWHNNQITTPTNLVNLMLVFGEELPQDLIEKAQPMINRAHMNASGARPSGDRIVIAGIVAKNLLFLENKDEFDKIIRIIEGEIKFSTGKRGMQHDYSFHHRKDRVNNTTSYGYGKYANAFGEWSYYVANTQYEFSQEKIHQLIDYYLDGIYKQMVYGIYTDISVKNRSISRQTDFEPHGTVEIERLLVSTDYRKEELEEILKLRKGEAVPSQSYCKFFWQTEHFVCQRPDFYTTVRMYSNRNRNMEMPYNGPGITTHHRADGTNYVMLKGNEYHDIWPVYDWQKISGTTIMQKPQLHDPDHIQVEGLTDFVGAVTDGKYGAVAFDFISGHDLLKAKKSWFFFEEEYVCLGTEIYSEPKLPVITTINQVLMKGDILVREKDKEHVLTSDIHELSDVKWVHHDNIGYIFPEPTTVQLSNRLEQGSWSDITDQKNISEEQVNKEVFMLWLDHGMSPDSASYQYMIVPSITEQELRESSKDNRGIEILSNTPKIQAVEHKYLGICQVAFYQAGKIDLSEELTLSMESQGMAMIQLKEGALHSLTLSDPSRKLKKIMVTISGIHEINNEKVFSKSDHEQNTTWIVAELPQGVFAGKSLTITF